MLNDLFDLEHCGKYPEGFGGKAVDRPEAYAAKAKLVHQLIVGAQASPVIKPHHVPGFVLIFIIEVWRLGLLVKMNLDIVRFCKFARLPKRNGARSSALHIGQCPVIAVIGQAHEDLFRFYRLGGIFEHPTHLADGRYCHRRPIDVPPFIRH